MKLYDIIEESATAADTINELKSKRGTELPEVEKFRKALDPLGHDVFDKALRPDKKIKVDEDDTTEEISIVDGATKENGKYRIQPVERIGIALQKLIVKRAVSFLFGRPVELSAEIEKESNEETVLKAVKQIITDNKGKSLNRRVAREALSCTEVAEIWYPVPVDKTKTGSGIISKVKDAINNLVGNKYHEKYGFKSAYKLRCAVFSPLMGDVLYPYFDETGDMIAFSREFTRADVNKVDHKYFETYTDSEHWLWEHTQDGYNVVESYPRPIEIGKIPVVYAQQDQVEWADVQNLIDRLEKLLSNFADTNDYHASPKIFITGHITGFSKKGEAGGIIEGEDGSKAEYLAWANAPESVKLEIATLLNLIYTLTQTPDISFESVKGIGAISGIALKLLFLDAHLKVADHQEVFDEYMQRRINVIKAYIGKFNNKLEVAAENLNIEPVITPYMIDDEIADIQKWTTANGGKPVISQKASMGKAALTDDTEADFEQMQAETDRANQFMIGEPTQA